LGTDLNCHETVEFKGVKLLAANSGYLVAANDRELSVYALDDQGIPRPVGKQSLDAIARIVPLSLSGRDRHFLVEWAKGFALLDLANPDRIDTLGEFPTAPDLAGATRIGRFLIMPDVDGTSLKVLMTGAVKKL
jgi:hypothetical protein